MWKFIPSWLRACARRKSAAPVPTGGLTVDGYLSRSFDQRYQDECTPEVRANATELVRRVNGILGLYGTTPAINSGWRPKSVNRAVGGAPRSAHVTGEAIDLDDDSGRLKAFCAAYEGAALEAADLYMESPNATKGWCHLQTRRTGSGRRVFIP